MLCALSNKSVTGRTSGKHPTEIERAFIFDFNFHNLNINELKLNSQELKTLFFKILKGFITFSFYLEFYLLPLVSWREFRQSLPCVVLYIRERKGRNVWKLEKC